MTFQAAYEANLRVHGRGMALYKPLEFKEDVPRFRVGDVFFMSASGRYDFIQNAFNREALPAIKCR
jgi:hypothetical protein